MQIPRFRLADLLPGPVTFVLALAACTPPTPAAPTRVLPTKPESVILGGGGEVDRDKVIEAGRRQVYDTNPGASHQDVLDDGVTAVIEAQIGVYRITREELDRGMVVARFRDLSDAPLERLSLVPGLTTYWYIYEKDGKLWSAYVVDSPDPNRDRYDIPTWLHPPTQRWWQSIAQWQLPGVLHPGDKGGLGAGAATGSLPWVTCSDLGCCKPGN